MSEQEEMHDYEEDLIRAEWEEDQDALADEIQMREGYGEAAMEIALLEKEDEF